MAIDVTEHIGWANRIAARVYKSYRLRGSQEYDDLCSAAVIQLVEKAPQFVRPDPCDNESDAFRGWVYLWVQCACRREAQRLRNGGTYNTKQGAAIAVASADEFVEFLAARDAQRLSHGDLRAEEW